MRSTSLSDEGRRTRGISPRAAKPRSSLSRCGRPAGARPASFCARPPFARATEWGAGVPGLCGHGGRQGLRSQWPMGECNKGAGRPAVFTAAPGTVEEFSQQCRGAESLWCTGARPMLAAGVGAAAPSGRRWQSSRAGFGHSMGLEPRHRRGRRRESRLV